jgi:hypothetical protein
MSWSVLCSIIWDDVWMFDLIVGSVHLSFHNIYCTKWSSKWILVWSLNKWVMFSFDDT